MSTSRTIVLAVILTLVPACGSTYEPTINAQAFASTRGDCVLIGQFSETMSTSLNLDGESKQDQRKIVDHIRNQALIVAEQFRLDLRQQFRLTEAFGTVALKEDSNIAEDCLLIKGVIQDFKGGYVTPLIWDESRTGARPPKLEGDLDEKLSTGYHIDRLDTAEFLASIAIFNSQSSDVVDEFVVKEFERKLGRLTRKERNIEDLLKMAAKDVAKKVTNAKFGNN